MASWRAGLTMSRGVFPRSKCRWGKQSELRGPTLESRGWGTRKTVADSERVKDL